MKMSVLLSPAAISPCAAVAASSTRAQVVPTEVMDDAALIAVDQSAEVYAVATATRALVDRGLPAGVQDYVLTVRPQADSWSSVHPQADPGQPALDGVSRADVVRTAADFAAEHSWAAGARLVTDRAWRTGQDWIETLLAPLAVGGSLVLVQNAEPATVQRRAEQERATAVLTGVESA